MLPDKCHLRCKAWGPGAAGKKLGSTQSWGGVWGSSAIRAHWGQIRRGPGRREPPGREGTPQAGSAASSGLPKGIRELDTGKWSTTGSKWHPKACWGCRQRLSLRSFHIAPKKSFLKEKKNLTKSSRTPIEAEGVILSTGGRQHREVRCVAVATQRGSEPLTSRFVLVRNGITVRN